MVIRFLVKGRVQGVGFRWFVYREAAQLELRGWVRNTDEGELEAVVAGKAEALEILRRSLIRGPRGSRVDGLEEFPLPASEEQALEPFRIEGAW